MTWCSSRFTWVLGAVPALIPTLVYPTLRAKPWLPDEVLPRHPGTSDTVAGTHRRNIEISSSGNKTPSAAVYTLEMVRRRSTRALSLLLAIVLVVTPVALLARSTAHGKAKCSGMCCRPHARHVADQAASAILPQETKSTSHSEEMSCNRGAAAHLAMCMLPSSTDT